MARPRKVNLIKTEHFDILYSEPSTNSAKFLADNVEQLYMRAKEMLEGANDLHIPIIISPDSDKLSVDYTSSPYNRIVFFEGVPDKDSIKYENVLLGLFYHEIYLALSQSIRSPFNQFIYKTIGGDSYQPISMIYLPFSFVEGRSFLEDGHFYDPYYLQILSIAKYENKFPNWLQASTIRDIYPGRHMNEAAGSAFSAYLMQTYGVEKYVELWNMCGDLNFRLTAGMFKKAYGISLNELWDDFEESIPLPENLSNPIEEEKKVTKLFPNDKAGVFSNLLFSDYGLVWYDDIRHEVSIYDWNSQIKIRQLLFLANDIKKLTLSPDGRYLILSFYGTKNRSDFRDDKVKIFDLKKRTFLDCNFELRDGMAFNLGNGQSVICGINVKEKHPILQLYSINYEDTDEIDLIYSRSFAENEYPQDLTYCGNDKLSYIVNKNGENFLCIYYIQSNEEKFIKLQYKDKPVKIKDLRHVKTDNYIESSLKYKNIYSFVYLPEDEPAFSRLGIIYLNDNFEPEKVFFQVGDISGGVNYPVIYDNVMFYCADKYTHTEIHSIKLSNVIFQEGRVMPVADFVNLPIKPVGEYEINKYNPFKYMLHCSFIPFMAIKDLPEKNEQQLWPSLGGTIITQDDPFMNNRIMVSGSAGYAKLDFMALVNPSNDDINDEKNQNVDDDKFINFGISFENTATPVDIRIGSLFKFNQEGEYNFEAAVNTLWQIPLGVDFSNLKIGIHSNYVAATDYYDSNLSDHYPSLSGWPAFDKAYETANVAVGVEYSNIHQYGLSKYQNRGFSVGAMIYSFWDLYEIRILNKKMKEKDQGSQGIFDDLTVAQISKLYNKELMEMSQLNIGLYGTIEIPMLNPLTMYNGLVLSLPTTIYAEMFNQIGTAVKVGFESLLLGYEPQNGIPFLYLFFSRLGLKLGYELNLNYDTYKVALPDIRRKDFLWDIFSNIYVRDSVYFIYDMDFSASIGKLSEYQMNLAMKTEFFPHSKGFAFTINFRVTY